MTTIALSIALALLTALAIRQTLVAIGLPYGRFVWGGTHRVLPGRLRLSSAACVLVILGIAVVFLVRGGALPGENSTLVIALSWVAFALFALSVPLNAVSRSPIERWTMTPTCIALAAATLVIALGM